MFLYYKDFLKCNRMNLLTASSQIIASSVPVSSTSSNFISKAYCISCTPRAEGEIRRE